MKFNSFNGILFIFGILGQFCGIYGTSLRIGKNLNSPLAPNNFALVPISNQTIIRKYNSHLESGVSIENEKLSNVNQKEVEDLEKKVISSSNITSISNTNKSIAETTNTTFNHSVDSNLTITLMKKDGKASQEIGNISSNTLLSALEMIKENKWGLTNNPSEILSKVEIHNALNSSVSVASVVMEKKILNSTVNTSCNSNISNESMNETKVLELPSHIPVLNETFMIDNVANLSNSSLTSNLTNISSIEIDSINISNSTNSSEILNNLLKKKINKRSFVNKSMRAAKKILFDENELNKSLTKAIKKMRESDDYTEFNLTINNTKLESYTKYLESFNVDSNKLAKLTKWLYKKVKIVVKEFKDIKKHYGKLAKDEIQKKSLDYLSNDNLVEKQLIVGSEHLENLKEKISSFYKENVETISESQDNSKDLVKIKEKLLDIVKRVENLSKINILQQEILRKAKEIVSDIELNIIRENLNDVIELQGKENNTVSTLPKIEKDLNKINSHL